MSIQKNQYEEALAEYSSALDAIALLRRYRPYLEMIPSMRRPHESVITIPLPIARFRQETNLKGSKVFSAETCCLPCDVAILMCDPEWKIKTGVEIFVFIHRPQEDFSDLLGRWRQTQVQLSHGYEWDMPFRYRHILSEGSDTAYPLFVLFEGSSERVKRGLKGAFLPFVMRKSSDLAATPVEEPITSAITEDLWSDSEDLLSE
jgi:hypothetical protein